MLVLKSCDSSTSSLLSDGSRNKSRKSKKSKASLNDSPKNAFESMYTTTCAKYKTRPLRCVKINNKTNSIEILGDCMKADDWQAAMEALSTDTSTHHLRIKNKQYTGNLAKNYDTFSSVLAAPKHIQASGTLYVVQEIASTINKVLTNTNALVCLELENVLFDERSLEVLMSGMLINQTLQHVSLANSRMGDNACLTLCRMLRNKPNIRSLNLTRCQLSPSSARLGLVDLIKKQQFKRHEECWAHSLRSRSPNPDLMKGLRRLTLNDNPSLGDEGVIDLLEALKDDMYVKALDLQNCGLTDRGVQLALSTLMVNDTLVILDLRKNVLVSSDVLENVMTQLCANNVNKSEIKEWKWTKLNHENLCESTNSLASKRRSIVGSSRFSI